jgi:hypothetical protein
MFLKVVLLSYELQSCTSYPSWYFWCFFFCVLKYNSWSRPRWLSYTSKFTVLYYHISFGNKECYSTLLLFIWWLTLSCPIIWIYLFVLANRTGSEINLSPRILQLPLRIKSIGFFKQFVSCPSDTHLQHRWPNIFVHTHQHLIMSIAKAWMLYRPLRTIFNDLNSFCAPLLWKLLKRVSFEQLSSYLLVCLQFL